MERTYKQLLNLTGEELNLFIFNNFFANQTSSMLTTKITPEKEEKSALSCDVLYNKLDTTTYQFGHLSPTEEYPVRFKVQNFNRFRTTFETTNGETLTVSPSNTIWHTISNIFRGWRFAESGFEVTEKYERLDFEAKDNSGVPVALTVSFHPSKCTIVFELSDINN